MTWCETDALKTCSWLLSCSNNSGKPEHAAQEKMHPVVSPKNWQTLCRGLHCQKHQAQRAPVSPPPFPASLMPSVQAMKDEVDVISKFMNFLPLLLIKAPRFFGLEVFVSRASVHVGIILKLTFYYTFSSVLLLLEKITSGPLARQYGGVFNFYGCRRRVPSDAHRWLGRGAGFKFYAD